MSTTTDTARHTIIESIERLSHEPTDPATTSMIVHLAEAYAWLTSTAQAHGGGPVPTH